MVLDLFAGTLSSAVTCLLLNKNRSFLGIEKDSGCLKSSWVGDMEVCAWQLLNDKFSFIGAEESMEAAQGTLVVESLRLKQLLN